MPRLSFFRIFFLLIASLVFNGVGVLSLWAQSESVSEPVRLQWSPDFSPLDKSTLSPVLYFKHALYQDSLPDVPFYLYRKAAILPHYSYEFSLEDMVWVPCNEQESSLLQTRGYTMPEVVMHRQVEVSSGQSFINVHVIPLRYVQGGYEKLESFRIVSRQVFDPTLSYGSNRDYPISSVLAQGDWFRICVNQSGVHRLGFEDLQSLGINPAQLDKASLQLFGNPVGVLPEDNALTRFTDLRENAIWVSGNNQGPFTSTDFILFYGQSPHVWTYDPSRNIFAHQVHDYSDEQCYFLTHSQNPGKRVVDAGIPDQTPLQNVNRFLDYAYHQRDQANLIGSGKVWYGESFDLTLARDFEFDFPNVDRQMSAHARVYAAARAPFTSSYTIRSGVTSGIFTIPSVNLNNATGAFAHFNIGELSFFPEGDRLKVNLTYNPAGSGSRGWLNYIAVNVWRELIMQGTQMGFRNPKVQGADLVARFDLAGATPGIVVWDISDLWNVSSIQGTLSGGVYRFSAKAHAWREYIAFTGQSFLKPRLAGRIPNQNLHGMVVHDLIIVVPDFLRPQAQRLADFRKSFDGLTVALVSPQQIYNEFSSGMQDISAIRNFLKMFYDRATLPQEYPRYLLLFGNGTYDNKNRLGLGGNFIPTFQTIQSLSPANSYISDDFFGLLDDHEGYNAQGSLDLGIGRIPVRTPDEARFVVDKLLRYNQRIAGWDLQGDNAQFAGKVSNYADWRNIITLIADDEDFNIHFTQAETLSTYLKNHHSVYNVEKIYLDAYQQFTLAGGSRYPDVNRAINNRVNQGALLINYIGHGGVQGLADERILTFDDIFNWTNFYNLPVFMTATCEFSSFDQPDPNELSAGVRIFLKPDGGAAALFTTTRLAYSHSNFALNYSFMRNAFQELGNGEMPRLGDLIRISKAENASISQIKNFVLLGDPSMQLAYPKNRVVTTVRPDTIKALQKVRVEGYVTDRHGGLLSGYQGVIYPTVYDKAASFSTQANDPGSPVASFAMQNRILYKGKAEIKNGQFAFTFIVPRDISYNLGVGKISYYFDNGLEDGCGYDNQFVVAGTSDTYAADDQGPEIRLYLNNLNFKSGDRTGPDPVLIALISDESGINTTGQLGHDIVAFLNDNTANPIVLNQFYEATLNSFQQGRVVFPFHNLEPGSYRLSLRAWDVYNNPGMASLDFSVIASPQILITDLINYPNPFSDRTSFGFNHNKPASELLIQIDIFDLQGKFIRQLESKVYASGYDIPPIEWDGTDNGGTPARNGIYLFRLSVSDAAGQTTVKSQRLVIYR